ncbi:MAG TPA: glycosyltransferase family 1 protein [Candidatus Limnocylindrales bacterium]|nr:glycosyltransferase family 1 protein [Candidatus Limnocylindrales bacterium]
MLDARTLDGVGIDLLFAAPPFTGLEHHALHILRGLNDVDTHVDVFVQEDVAPAIAEAAEGHRLIPFPRVPRALRLGREQWAIPWRFGVHPRSYRLLHGVIGVAPLLLDLPLVLTVPDLTYRATPQQLHPRARWYFATLVPRSIRRARRVMVSSEAVRREVIDVYHIAPDRVVRVPLCADAIFHPQPPEVVVDVRKRYGLPERYVLYVGTIDPRKDLARLRAAYDLLPPDLSDAALVIAGRTAHGAERLARELRRGSKHGHVLTIGYVPRESLPALYAGAAVFVYPSRYEGFGLPVLEAMACGAPVIVSGADALRELVADAGVVVSSPEVEALTQAVERVLRFDDERKDLQQRALVRASQFSARRLGEQTAAVYRQALSA